MYFYTKNLSPLWKSWITIPSYKVFVRNLRCVWFAFHFLFSFPENCFHFQKIRILKTCLVWLLENWFRHFIYSIRMYALENWFRHFNKHLIGNKNIFNPSTQECVVTTLHCVVEPPLFAGVAPHHQQTIENATKLPKREQNHWSPNITTN